MLNYTSCGKIPKGLNDHNCSNTHSPLALFTNKITHWTWEMSLGKENFFLQPFQQILYSPHEFTNSTFTILIVINSNLECGLLCIKTDIWFLRLNIILRQINITNISKLRKMDSGSFQCLWFSLMFKLTLVNKLYWPLGSIQEEHETHFECLEALNWCCFS